MIREIEQLKKEICWSQRVFISVHVRPPTCPVNSFVCGRAWEAQRKRAWRLCVFVHLPRICIPFSSLSRGETTWDQGHVWLKIYFKKVKRHRLLHKWGLMRQRSNIFIIANSLFIRLVDDTKHDIKHPHLCCWFSHLGSERSAIFLFQSWNSRPQPRVSCVAALPGSVYLPSFRGLLSKHTVCIHLFPSSIARRLPPSIHFLLLWLLWQQVMFSLWDKLILLHSI